MSKKHLLGAVSTLVGFTIGAGILGIPYVVVKAGFTTGIVNIIVIGIATLILNLYLGEIVLRTKGIHQLTGYAEKYLGKNGKVLMTIAMIFAYYGALVAYTVKVGEFIAKLFMPVIGGDYLIYVLVSFVIMSLFVYVGLKMVEKGELSMVLFMVLIMVVFSFVMMPKIDYSNLTGFDLTKLFIPYGVVLFAFAGSGAIPEIGEELKNNKKLVKKAIIIGSLIPLFIYLLFAFLVVGVAGNNTTDGAIIGLESIFGTNILVLGVIFGVLAMATSFIAVGLALKGMYQFDFKLKRALASNLTCLIPLVVSFIIIQSKIKNSFFHVLDVTGAFAGSLICILIVMMFLKSKKLGDRKPEFCLHKNSIISLILILMFIAGMAYKFFNF